MISKIQLEECLEAENRKCLVIVITVGNEVKTSRLYAKAIRFGSALKVVEKYWEAGPISVYMTCSGIDHNRLRRYNEKPEQYVIYIGVYKI